MSGEDARRPAGGEVTDRGLHYSVKVLVDGRQVPLKEFLHDMLGGAVVGLVSGLRGVEDPAEVVIEVARA